MMVERLVATPQRRYRPVLVAQPGGADHGAVNRVKDSAAMTDAQSMALKSRL